MGKSLKVKVYTLQIFYWMSFCSVSGFATVFLLSKQISNSKIGAIIAIGSLLSVFAQFATGVLVDKYSKLSLRRVMLLFFGLSLVTALVIIAIADNIFLMAIFYCLAIVLLFNIQPLITAIIYSYINIGADLSFSFSRGLGSMMFATFSFFMGIWLEKHSTISVPIMSAFLMGVLFLIVASLPEIDEGGSVNALSDEPTSLWELHHKYPSFVLFFIGISVIFSFHTVANVYLPQIVGNVGGGNKEIGFAIALAAFCEIPAMFGFKRLEEKFNVIVLLRISAIFFFVKALIFVIAPNFGVLLSAQVLQILSFAIITPAYAHYVNEWMAPKDRVKGQTIMMAGVTLGNVIGSLGGGILLDQSTVFGLLIFGVILAFAGMVMILISLRGKEKVIQVD